ncbi:hypothetical protein [Rubellicoccus peritrichatus]|uniref:Uncharacterized protein n=1 Tax=Rubellicoccus peritrichatus TaxID=3080537 RepID=A0AAQ3L7J2_9BACT|nr:hypothetical protein [Puniceicoccus sp. CR14]WOO40387.1 hypothetical protein RZN69_17345 [Puniceicoccus sp. CR14]WOO40436.1 hypothetical protein RZN69_17590 [Puniceicoccus sp. CR14]WOO40485.1 hypothetical protein RZN69_17835 [Puniceicoccus sp. CR14]WOO40534.1 hypothetical protein RZN69_18080 [Puniceicoccus sp. CR14]
MNSENQDTDISALHIKAAGSSPSKRRNAQAPGAIAFNTRSDGGVVPHDSLNPREIMENKEDGEEETNQALEALNGIFQLSIGNSKNPLAAGRKIIILAFLIAPSRFKENSFADMAHSLGMTNYGVTKIAHKLADELGIQSSLFYHSDARKACRKARLRYLKEAKR